jgi:hypothetical protein
VHTCNCKYDTDFWWILFSHTRACLCVDISYHSIPSPYSISFPFIAVCTIQTLPGSTSQELSPDARRMYSKLDADGDLEGSGSGGAMVSSWGRWALLRGPSIERTSYVFMSSLCSNACADLCIFSARCSQIRHSLSAWEMLPPIKHHVACMASLLRGWLRKSLAAQQVAVNEALFCLDFRMSHRGTRAESPGNTLKHIKH